MEGLPGGPQAHLQEKGGIGEPGSVDTWAFQAVQQTQLACYG